jgi:filamentous hemagglutinin family protein
LPTLVNGDTATFSGPAAISNVISRVTGGSQSSIDGEIRSITCAVREPLSMIRS